MGTKLAPSFANLFMGDFEEKFVYTYKLQPFLWKRFIDDIFIIWTHGAEELSNFVSHLNSCHRTIKFTSESSDKSIDFLDVTIKTTDKNSLITTLYCKPTDSHNYLLYSSEHPRHILNGIPYSQFLRVRRICSELSDFKSNAFMLTTHFIRRGYPKHLVLKSLKRCLEQNRDELLNKELMKKPTTKRSPPDTENTFYCITTHNPLNPNIKSIANKTGTYSRKQKRLDISKTPD